MGNEFTFDLLVARYPDRELELRRACVRDTRVFVVCSDYEAASVAWSHWQEVAGENDYRVAEYARLLTELEAELLALLDETSRPSISPFVENVQRTRNT